MSDHDAVVLTTVTRTLIDSQKGYRTCSEVVSDDPVLSAELMSRHYDRVSLVHVFQTATVALRGSRRVSGSTFGALHRGLTRLTALFRNERFAAGSALDDGEEYLTEMIESRLEDASLQLKTRDLLQMALVSARGGERLAARLLA